MYVVLSFWETSPDVHSNRPRATCFVLQQRRGCGLLSILCSASDSFWLCVAICALYKALPEGLLYEALPEGLLYEALPEGL